MIVVFGSPTFTSIPGSPSITTEVKPAMSLGAVADSTVTTESPSRPGTVRKIPCLGTSPKS